MSDQTQLIDALSRQVDSLQQRVDALSRSVNYLIDKQTEAHTSLHLLSDAFRTALKVVRPLAPAETMMSSRYKIYERKDIEAWTPY